MPEISASQPDGLVIVGTAALYAQGLLLSQSDVLKPRINKAEILLNSADAKQYGITNGDLVSVLVNGEALMVTASVNGDTSAGLALLRGVNSTSSVTPAAIKKVEVQEE